ncbi:outer membrane protein transport protein [Coraliomargarita sp. SDUM461003]|uniref:Outer membrane protein transport protein n=1 Tax=Thalassobacterium maritimum TaxID=3041265 RepID=A0ABU1AQR3_9BACT|nr:outer membrane protein transport protein [Coraliomargarita sp. SDUM461003]MDQ8206473.1 outer membrane protein transport protein [Coraliomargarita sp. SDUM461003]
MKPLQRPLFTLGLSLLAYVSTDAAATRVAFIDPFATARGNAFTATADNPSAVFYNAAGLTQVEGTQVQGNVFTISLGYEYSSSSGNDSLDDSYQAIPSAFISHKFKDTPIALGFGMYAPFALGTDWGDDASFTAAFPNPESAVPHKADLTYVKYHAVVAWQISESFSLAAGLSFDDTDIDLQTNALEFNGQDSAVGYSLSALWQPSAQHSFGLNYQAKTEVSYDGTVSGPAVSALLLQSSVDTTADFSYPESIVFGYSYRPSEHWNFEFNLDWTNWDRVNELELKGTPFAYTLNWESAFIWELGLTRYFDNGWQVSAGYTFVENAVPDSFLLPIVPDSDRHFLAIGLGRSYENLSWQITYQQAFASERKLTGNKTSSSIDGSYDLDSQAVAISLNYRF